MVFTLASNKGYWTLSCQKAVKLQKQNGWILVEQIDHPHTPAHTHSSPHRAQVLVLHLLELGISVAGTQLHISQHHLEHRVVDGLGEVHVQLVHGSLQREERAKHTVMKIMMSGSHRHLSVWICEKANSRETAIQTSWRHMVHILDILNYLQTYYGSYTRWHERKWGKLSLGAGMLKSKRKWAILSAVSMIHISESSSVL